MSVYSYDDIIKMRQKQEIIKEEAVYTFNGKYKDSNGKEKTEKNEGNPSIKINILRERKKEKGVKQLPHDNRLKIVQDKRSGPSIEFFKDNDYTYSQLLEKDVFKNDNDKSNKNDKDLNYYKDFTLAASIYARNEIKEFMSNTDKSYDEVNDKIAELFEKTRSYKSSRALRVAANDEWMKRNPNKELPKKDKEDYIK